jgi:uncharacterized protein YqjF (DUF2071 family)
MRPWPVPERPWAMAQTWHDLLFAHWPVDPGMLRPSIPQPLALDTYEGQAWIGVVPFRMSDVYLREIPLPFPWLSAFPELNVRTYVTAPGGEKPGVWFYSLDAANPVAVAVARLWYRLPYYAARMRCRRVGRHIHYRSHRIHPGAPAADFRAHYGPTGPVFQTTPGSLEDWLTARYCLYAHERQARVWRGEIDHARWLLQHAEADLRMDRLTTQHGIHLPDTAPLLHFARHLTVHAWTLDHVV